MTAQQASRGAEPAVVFVGSDARVTPAADIAREGHRVIEIGALAGDTLAGAAAIVVDIDLGEMAARETLRAAIARLKRHPPLIFAVDRGPHLHLQATQANALGASTVIKRPVNAEAIRAALAELSVKDHLTLPPARLRQ